MAMKPLVCTNRFEEGYWWNNSLVEAVELGKASPDTVNAFPCAVPQACTVQGSNRSTCAPGHAGILCATCLPGYSTGTDGLCSQCWHPAVSWLLLLLFVGAVAAGVVLLGRRAIASKQQQQNLLPEVKKRRDPAVTTKIMLNFMQTVTFLSDFDLQWPDFASALLSSVGVASGFVFSSSFLGCALGWTTVGRFASVAAFLPIVVIVPAGVIFFMSSKHREDEFTKADEDEEYVPVPLVLVGMTPQQLYMSAIMIFIFFTYPMVTRQALDMLVCTPLIGGDSYMVADTRISCSSPSYSIITGFAGLVLAVVTIGFPLLAVALIWPLRNRLDGDKAQRRFGFLLKGYKHSCFWYESIIMFRKAAVATSSVLLRTASPTVQLWAGLLVQLLFMVIHVTAKPYKTRTHDGLELVCMVSSVFLLVLGQGFLLPGVASETRVLLTFITTFCILATIGACVFFIVLDLYRIAMDAAMARRVLESWEDESGGKAEREDDADEADQAERGKATSVASNPSPAVARPKATTTPCAPSSPDMAAQSTGSDAAPKHASKDATAASKGDTKAVLGSKDGAGDAKTSGVQRSRSLASSPASGSDTSLLATGTGRGSPSPLRKSLPLLGKQQQQQQQQQQEPEQKTPELGMSFEQLIRVERTANRLAKRHRKGRVIVGTPKGQDSAQKGPPSARKAVSTAGSAAVVRSTRKIKGMWHTNSLQHLLSSKPDGTKGSAVHSSLNPLRRLRASTVGPSGVASTVSTAAASQGGILRRRTTAESLKGTAQAEGDWPVSAFAARSSRDVKGQQDGRKHSGTASHGQLLESSPWRKAAVEQMRQAREEKEAAKKRTRRKTLLPKTLRERREAAERRWRKAVHPELNEPYWYNLELKQMRWEQPAELDALDDEERRVLGQWEREEHPEKKIAFWVHPELGQTWRRPHGVPLRHEEAWVRTKHPVNGMPCFVNLLSQVTTWEKPDGYAFTPVSLMHPEIRTLNAELEARNKQAEAERAAARARG